MLDWLLKSFSPSCLWLQRYLLNIKAIVMMLTGFLMYVFSTAFQFTFDMVFNLSLMYFSAKLKISRALWQTRWWRSWRKMYVRPWYYARFHRDNVNNKDWKPYFLTKIIGVCQRKGLQLFEICRRIHALYFSRGNL